jgi:MFS family permease
MVFAPLSEMYGRRKIYAVTLAFAVLFILPCAKAVNVEMLVVFRLLDGLAFAATLALVGGTLCDMWNNDERRNPMTVAVAAIFHGPVCRARFHHMIYRCCILTNISRSVH